MNKYEDVHNSEQVESWQKSKEIRDVMKQYPNEEAFNEASLNTALQIQFENEMDIEKMKKRIADKLLNKKTTKDESKPVDGETEKKDYIEDMKFANML